MSSYASSCADSTEPAEPGRLFIWFPVGLAVRKVRQYLQFVGRRFVRVPSGAIVVDAPEGYPDQLLIDLSELLTDYEGADTRCVFKAGTADLDVDDIAEVRTLHELRARRTSAWFVDLLHGDRLTSVFQPIVHTSHPSRVLGHEAFVRGIDASGHALPPTLLFGTARGCGMLTELDCAARASAIRAAATHDEHRPLFVNVTTPAVRDVGRSLSATVAAAEQARIPRDHIVLELTEAEKTTDLRHARGVVDCFRQAGFQVSLDDIGVGQRGLQLMHELRPDYVKVDVRRLKPGERRAASGDRIFEHARHLKIVTIAEGVENDEELEWSRDGGAEYVQGYLIGRPKAEPVAA
jgi:EAL domain-containing protein (putative c-di-GMP-specific phosphodiesterase class I)